MPCCADPRCAVDRRAMARDEIRRALDLWLDDDTARLTLLDELRVAYAPAPVEPCPDEQAADVAVRRTAGAVLQEYARRTGGSVPLGGES